MNRTNFSAKTLDEAITKACVELGVTSDMLDYTVMEQGSSGILGIGARPWVISAVNKADLEAEAQEAAKAARAAELAAAEKKSEAAKKKPEEKNLVKEEKSDDVTFEEALAIAAKYQEDHKTVKKSAEPETVTMKEAASKEAGEAAEKKAVEFLKQVFDSIGMEVQINSHFDEMLSELDIELSGDEMGLLIGKRGQTLNSLQYLIGQIINKHCSNYIRVKLDTENYRERRQETLENLAHNMAAKVRRTHHAMALEPMNPYERRIIHSSLQDEKDVITKSEGEEPYRHVVICFVKHKK